MCDGFRALATVLPGCLATVVKSHRTWIPTLRFHPPAKRVANGDPQGSHLNPPSNGASAPVRAPPMHAPPKIFYKSSARRRSGLTFGEPLVESHLEPETATLVVGAAERLIQANKEYY